MDGDSSFVALSDLLRLGASLNRYEAMMAELDRQITILMREGWRLTAVVLHPDAERYLRQVMAFSARAGAVDPEHVESTAVYQKDNPLTHMDTGRAGVLPVRIDQTLQRDIAVAYAPPKDGGPEVIEGQAEPVHPVTWGRQLTIPPAVVAPTAVQLQPPEGEDGDSSTD